MASLTLYNDIENIIRNRLHLAYNKSTAKVSFHLSESFPEKNDALQFGNFSVAFNDSYFNGIKQVRRRFPQTRIFLSSALSREFRITELQYFDTSIILIRNYSESELDLHLSTDKSLLNETGILPDKSSIKIPAFAVDIFWTDQHKKKAAQILRSLDLMFEEEKSFNPLSRIFSNDNAFLKEVDMCWAALDWKNRKEAVQINKTDKNLSQAFSLLMAELAIFTSKPSHGATNNRPAIENIQNTWNILSLPAFGCKTVQIVKSDLSSLIIFLLGAYENNFWWADMARIYIQDIVRKEQPLLEPLFNLVFILKSNFNMYPGEKTIGISNFAEFSIGSTYTIRTAICSAKWVQSKKESFSYVTFNEINTVSINKKARFIYYKNKEEIVIQPQLFQYEFKPGNTLRIKFADVVVILPLLWKEFTVFFGDIRMKFLFKKNRYQISIKGDGQLKEMFINDTKMSFESGRYLKIYYVPQRLKAGCNIYYFDKQGRVLQNNKAKGSFVVNCVAWNSWGQLVQNLHVRKQNSQKNIQLKDTGLHAGFDTGYNYELIIPGGFKEAVHMDNIDSYMDRLLAMPADLLEERLCLFLKDNKRTTSIRKAFYAVFGFFPAIQMLPNLDYVFACENLIISNKNENKNDPFLYTEMVLKEDGQKKALIFSEKNFFKWLDLYKLY